MTAALASLPLDIPPPPGAGEWPQPLAPHVAEHPPTPECVAFAESWPHLTVDLCMAVDRSDMWGEPIRALFPRPEWGTAAAVVACESMGNPNARGGGGWQFTRATARQYGLKDATNPVASTAAAARMLEDRGGWEGWACWARVHAPALWERVYLPHKQAAA